MPVSDKDKPSILSQNLFPIVGIGASAGGLDAFKKLHLTDKKNITEFNLNSYTISMVGAAQSTQVFRAREIREVGFVS